MLKQLQLGNEAALTQVYRRLERPLYGFAYAMTGSPPMAEALRQQFIALEEDFDEPASNLEDPLVLLHRSQATARLARRFSACPDTIAR